MGFYENSLASDAKVPDMGQRQRHSYQQTVPVEEETDLPPSYEEASLSRTYTRPSTISSPAITSAALSSNDTEALTSRPDSFEADADDSLLGHGPSSHRGEQRRQRVEEQRQSEQQQRQRVEQERQWEKSGRQAEEQNRRKGVRREQEVRALDEQWRQSEEQGYDGRDCGSRDEHRSHCPGSTRRQAGNHDTHAGRASIDTVGYTATSPLYWENKAHKGIWDKYDGQAGYCGSTTGGCCLSSRGGCCFSDREGCFFSDRGGCCFSDRGGCFFSDLGGAFFSTGEACCFSNRSSHTDGNGVRL